jgi:hypothetical protein
MERGKLEIGGGDPASDQSKSVAWLLTGGKKPTPDIPESMHPSLTLDFRPPEDHNFGHHLALRTFQHSAK